MSNKEITRKSYQSTAQAYADKVADLAPMHSIEKFIKFLPEHARILDLGCGSGRDAKLFSDLGATVVGIDFCESLIAIAKTQAPMAEFHVMDIEKMNFPPASFDGVWAAASLLHISKSNFLEVLKNIHKILKIQGCLYLSMKKGSGETLEVDSRYEGNFEKFWSYFEEAELLDCLHAAKFKILEFANVEKNHVYQSHPYLRAFCQKE